MLEDEGGSKEIVQTFTYCAGLQQTAENTLKRTMLGLAEDWVKFRLVKPRTVGISKKYLLIVLSEFLDCI